MRTYPREVKVGPFSVEPESRNVKVVYIIGKQEMRVERADVPELIEALQKAYGL